MIKGNSRTQSRFNHAIKLTIRERDKAELERLSDRLDLEPRQLGRISLLRGLQLIARHGIDIRPEQIEGRAD